jgi:hypothetical protein
VSRKRVRKRPPALDPATLAAYQKDWDEAIAQGDTAGPGFGALIPFTEIEETELRRVAQQIIDGRKELRAMRPSKHKSTRQEMLDRIEEKFTYQITVVHNIVKHQWRDGLRVDIQPKHQNDTVVGIIAIFNED